MKAAQKSRYPVECLFVILLTLEGTAQDGATFDPKAKAYRAPPLSLAGAADTPERSAALVPLWQGDLKKGIPALTQLAEKGDVPAALLLGGLYRTQTQLAVTPDPSKALHFYKIASAQGSGEASERIAEMLEKNEVAPPFSEKSAAWRTLAIKQGWMEQRLSASCFDWTHGANPLTCEEFPVPANAQGSSPATPASSCPTSGEMALLREKGVTRTIRQDGGGGTFNDGPHARAVVLVDLPKHLVLTETWNLGRRDAALIVRRWQP